MKLYLIGLAAFCAGAVFGMWLLKMAVCAALTGAEEKRE